MYVSILSSNCFDFELTPEPEGTEPVAEDEDRQPAVVVVG
jgi:hypothetical protein